MEGLEVTIICSVLGGKEKPRYDIIVPPERERLDDESEPFKRTN